MSHRHNWSEFDGAPSTNVQLRYCGCGEVEQRVGGKWYAVEVKFSKLAIQLLRK